MLIGFEGRGKLLGRRNDRHVLFPKLSAGAPVFVGWRSAGIRALSLPAERSPSALQTCKSSQCDGEGGVRTECWSSHSQSGHTAATLTHFITCAIYQLFISATHGFRKGITHKIWFSHHRVVSHSSVKKNTTFHWKYRGHLHCFVAVWFGGVRA